MNFHIDPDISKSKTLPASFYRDPMVFEAIKEKIFLNSWQWIGDEYLIYDPQTISPFILLDGFLSEPMVLTKNKEKKIVKNLVKFLSFGSFFRVWKFFKFWLLKTNLVKNFDKFL